MYKHFDALIRDALRIFKGRYSLADATLDLATVHCRLDLEGIIFATKRLPGLSTSFLTCLETGDASFPFFRKSKKGIKHPVFLGRIFDLAFSSPDLDSTVDAINFIYTFCNSFKKLKGDYPQRVIQQFYADFCKTDATLGKIDFHHPSLRLVLEDARHQCRIFVKESGLRDRIAKSTPQPGPGATNSPTKSNMRYRPHTRYTQIEEVFPYEEWFYPNPYYTFLSDAAYNGIYNYTVGSLRARFKAVPKTYGKPRGVCIEENEAQVFQQMLRKAYYDAIEAYFGDCIPLRDQSVNASRALMASKRMDRATIDESEASDRVARELVKYIWLDSPDIWQQMSAVSSRYIVPPDEVKEKGHTDHLRLNKFAPMGSALCFPIMSLVHIFLIRAIIRVHNCGDVTQACNDVSVYGDDIILPIEYTELIYKELPKYGMKINTEKSFFRSKFRESCGIHAYNGVDITPVYVKYIPDHNLSEALASVFAVEAQYFTKGLFHTAELHRETITQTYGFYPEVPAGLSLAGFSRPPTEEVIRAYKNYTRVGVHRKLQESVHRIKRFKKRSQPLELSQLDAYVRWMWTKTTNFSSDKVSDSLDDLVQVTSTVLESAIGPRAMGQRIDELLKRFPTASERYTHPSWFGRRKKYLASANCYCYL